MRGKKMTITIKINERVKMGERKKSTVNQIGERKIKTTFELERKNKSTEKENKCFQNKFIVIEC